MFLFPREKETKSSSLKNFEEMDSALMEFLHIQNFWCDLIR